MLYLTTKTSAPAAVRRSCAAKQAARTRRLNARAVARVQRAARIAATHTTPAAVLVTPITPAARVAAMLITDDITGRFARNAAAVTVARVYPRPILTRTDEGYRYIQPDGPAALVAVNDTMGYSRPATLAPSAAVYIPANSPTCRAASTSFPAPEYNTSAEAKTAVQARQYGNVQTLAVRATISAVKLAIAPRARFIDVAVVDESTTIIDGDTVKVETLDSADGDARGSYTSTLKNALAALQVYAHSDVAAYPDNADAADLLSVATLAILDNARRVGVDAETWASGYNVDGMPFTRIVDGARGGARANVGKILVGYRAVFATITAAVNSAIRGEKTRQDGKISIDAVSMASDTQAPAHFDAPDVYSMDAAAAWELSDTITATIRAAAKSEDAAVVDVRICAMLSAGYTQSQIAKNMGRTQSYVAKRVAAIRSALSILL